MGSENKYKTRSPKETVSIIDGIFHDLSDKFKITILKERGKQDKVYSCSIALYYDGNIIKMANGKGMTRDYSLASAYAELYERFSNEIAQDGTLYPVSGSEGRRVAYEDAAQSTPFFREYMDEARLLATSYYPDNSLVWFECLNDSSQIELCPQHIYLEMGTTGMAAGNTIEEALVQGISEICERVVQSEAIFGRVSFQEIGDSLLKREAPGVYQRIKEINKKGIQVRYFDASESTGFPVMMSLWINKRLCTSAATFGSFPVFEIAAERCLTETLQGKDLNVPDMFDQITPYTEFGHDEYNRFLRLQSGILNEDLFLSSPVMCTLNTKVYVDKNLGNADLLEYFRKLFTEKSLNIYYRDTSLAPEMSSVQIYAPEFSAIPEKHEFLKEDLFISKRDFDDAHRLAEKIKTGKMDTASMMRFERDGVRPAVEHFFPTAFADRNAFGGALYDYIASIYAMKFKEYERAAELLKGVCEAMKDTLKISRYASVPNGPDFKIYENVNRLRLYAEYMDVYSGRPDRDFIVSRKMKLWGYEEDILLRNADDASILFYTLELTCGIWYRERIQHLETIAGIIGKAKEKYREGKELGTL